MSALDQATAQRIVGRLEPNYCCVKVETAGEQAEAA